MIKLLIVDDEEITREGLKRFIPWSELGVDQIFEAEDGLVALEIFEVECPDIILCDVRMPRMDGIQFAEKIREKSSDCKIIFLSGFSDKEYLKAAIKIGAVDYIEKPVVIKEIIAVVEKVVFEYKEEKKKLQEVLNIPRVQSLNELRQELLSTIVQSEHFFDIKEKELREKYKFTLKNNFFTAIIVLISTNKDCSLTDRKDVLSCLISTLNEKFKLFNLDAVAMLINNKLPVIILNEALTDNSKIKNSFVELIEEVMKEIVGKVKYSLAIGKPVNEIGNIYLSYKTAMEVSKKQFYMSYGKTIFFTEPSSSRYEANDNLIPSLESCLMEEDKIKAESIVKKLTSEISRHLCTDIDFTKHIYLNLYLCVCKVANKRNLKGFRNESHQEYYWKKISNFETLIETEEYLLEQIEKYYDLVEEKDNGGSQKIHEICCYIEKHFARSDLSVTEVANHINLSLNYMCNLFKKVTSITVNSYIFDVRMNKACELLKDIDTKLYMVADLVGFSDSNYFTRMFKRKFGMTPSNYRKKYLN